MIEVTGAMIQAFDDHQGSGPPNGWSDDVRAGLAAVFAIVERDNFVSPRPTPEEVAAWPRRKPRLRGCVERWPGAEIEGDYDPRCCRFPKSCSASVYDERYVTEADLEQQPGSTASNPLDGANA